MQGSRDSPCNFPTALSAKPINIPLNDPRKDYTKLSKNLPKGNVVSITLGDSDHRCIERRILLFKILYTCLFTLLFIFSSN